MIVSIPLCEPAWNPRTWPRLVEFNGRISALVEDVPGVTVLDAIDAVDHDLFYTHSHMSPVGHDAFAAWLMPHVVERLDSTPATAYAEATDNSY